MCFLTTFRAQKLFFRFYAAKVLLFLQSCKFILFLLSCQLLYQADGTGIITGPSPENSLIEFQEIPNSTNRRTDEQLFFKIIFIRARVQEFIERAFHLFVCSICSVPVMVRVVCVSAGTRENQLHNRSLRDA